MNARRALLHFGLPALFVVQALPSLAFAQSNACPVGPSSQVDPAKKTPVIVDQLEFEGDNPLTEAERADLLAKIQKDPDAVTSGPSDDDWAIEDIEVLVRGAFMDKGYAKLQLQGGPYLIRASNDGLHFALHVDVEPGPQYHLGDVAFANENEKGTSLAVSPDLLRDQLNLRSGDPFDTSKVRTAMDNISKLYTSKGYLDVVLEPTLDFKDIDSRIDLTMKIAEGTPYHIGGIELLGADGAARQQLRLPQSPGELVDQGLWRRFFEDNQSRFPAGADFDSTVKMIRNVRDFTTQITVDLGACPDSHHHSDSNLALTTKSGR